jgi:hypothetical protein
MHTSPFSVVFDVKHTGKLFWSDRVKRYDDEEDEFIEDPYVLYNIIVKNRSGRTIKDVQCYLDIGNGYKQAVPYDRTSETKMDFHPAQEELVNLLECDEVQERHSVR